MNGASEVSARAFLLGNAHLFKSSRDTSDLALVRETDSLLGHHFVFEQNYRGVPVSIKGEAHFGWALEGRAVQDVWIMPGIAERTSGSDRTNNMYGTTLRVWDSSIEAWRIYCRIAPAGRSSRM